MAELMNEQEIHEFGLEILVKYLFDKGYEIKMVQPEIEQIPHMIITKNDLEIFVVAATGVYPTKGAVADASKAALIENALKHGAQAAMARLGIVNAAGVELGQKDLLGKAYKDAKFLTDFSGLEFIQFED